MDQRYIEYDLPLAEISDESAREKYLGNGNPATLHIWWARRPLAASRATTLAALLSDPGPHKPEERRKIRSLIKQTLPLEAVRDGVTRPIEEIRRLIQEQYGDPPKILDPFSGGGAIPLEALRLGATVNANDYNPVAVLIEKATLEWPNRFGYEISIPENEKNDLELGGEKRNLLKYLVEKWGNKIYQDAEDQIGKFYPEEIGKGLQGKREVDPDQKGWKPIGYLWARSITCQNPTCDASIPLIKQFWLCRDDDKKICYYPIIDKENAEVDFKLIHGQELEENIEKGFDPKDGTVSRANASCLICGQVTEAEKVRQLGCNGDIGERLIAVVLRHPEETGKKYRLANDDDRSIFEKSKEKLKEKVSKWEYMDDPLPDEKITTYELSRVAPPLYGMERWKDIHNTRQKLALVTLLEEIKSKYEAILDDAEVILEKEDIRGVNAEEVSKAVVGYLALALDREAENSTKMCRWNPTGEKMQGTFGRQALPMSWDYLECNPFGGSVGDWMSLINLQIKGMQDGLPGPSAKPTATVSQENAADLSLESESLDAVITDPPYYDNVPYAALSDFFYVWMKRSMGDHFPGLFSTPLTPKSHEIVHDRPHEKSDSQKTKQYFEDKLGDSFEEMHRVLKPEGTAVVVYAHKTTEGWETMLNGLVEAGFVVTGSWPVHTEMKSRLIAAQTAALASSIYMVCRKIEREPLGFWNDIQPQIKERVEEKLEQFWEADIIRGGDFFISAIGPGMEAYSKYDRVETYSGEEVTVRKLLQYIRGVATDFLVRRLLRDVSSGSVDKEGQFYLTYRWTFRNSRVEYDDALRIAKAEGINLDRIAEQDSFIKKTRKYIYVHGPQDRNEIEEVHNMVDAMHLACQMWEAGRGKDEVGKMLAKHGYSQSPSFWQFCQAISECLPDGNKEKQWLEGMLMSKDQYQQVEAAGEGSDGEGQITIDFDEDGA